MIHLLIDEGKLDSECNDNRSVRFLYVCTFPVVEPQQSCVNVQREMALH